MKITLHVTANDIEQGAKGDCDECAVARAARRKIHPGCWVSNDYIKIPYSRKEVSYLCLPERIREWIRKFDQGEKVKPVRFSVEVAEELLP